MPTIHPHLSQLYRDMVERLEHELQMPELAAEAKSMLRSMIKTIVVKPRSRRAEVDLELQGELAALLAIGAKENKAPSNAQKSRLQVSVVAGTRNCHYLLFNAMGLSLVRMSSQQTVVSL